MKVLITAGGTSENIDSVRKITNTSTGRLGSLISSEFIGMGAEVTYITVKSAASPAPGCNVHYIQTAQDLYDIMRRLLSENKYDIIVHAMAVSDYTVERVTSLHELYDMFKSSCSAGLSKDEFINAVQSGEFGRQTGSTENGECIKNSDANAEGDNVWGNAGKLSKLPSGVEDSVIILKPTKKVISLIKELCPNSILFGFKLLAGADIDTLYKRASELAEKNNCDYMIANDITGISGDKHEAFIISKAGDVIRCSTKQDIAGKIADIAREQCKIF